MQEKGYSGDDSYALSKLASMMFTYDLAELMKPKGVTVNCLDPGTVNTKLLIAGWGACGIDIKVITTVALSAEQSSVHQLHALQAFLQPVCKQAVYLVHAMVQLEYVFADTRSFV